jgi:Plasma-membrane choline transporter
VLCYFEQIIVAVTIVKYYFSRDKSKAGAGTFFNALKIGFVYHMGTAAFGSLIVAIIQVCTLLFIISELL